MPNGPGAYKAKRPREYLTDAEMRLVVEASKLGRNRKRDHAMCLLMWHHGMRASELLALRISKLDLDRADGARISFERLKGSDDADGQLVEREVLKALRAWLKVRPMSAGDYVFGKKGQPLNRMALYYLVRSWGEKALIPFPIHPHMLRHSCGYHLDAVGATTRDIQRHLGHRDIRNTVQYTGQSGQRHIWGGRA